MDRTDKRRNKRHEIAKKVIVIVLALLFSIGLSLFIAVGIRYNDMPMKYRENNGAYYNGQGEVKPSFSPIVKGGSSSCIMDVKSGRVLGGSNMNTPLPMASTTKVITAIVAIEKCEDIDKVRDIPKKAIGIEGSSIYLKEGDRYSVRELLYGLMLRSGNDSAVAIACIVGGSEEKFVELMNMKAKELSLENTHYVNPHGLHDENHYTSAYDLAKISAYAMRNETFKEIVGTKSKVVGNSDDDTKKYFVNKNKILSMYEGATGIKTGFTKVAGRCLVSAAERKGMEVVSVVLNHGDMWNDSMNNLDHAFNNYVPIEIVKKDRLIENVSIGNKSVGACVKEDFVYPIKKGEEKTLEYSLDIGEVKNVESGVQIGKFKVYCNKRLIFETKLYSM